MVAQKRGRGAKAQAAAKAKAAQAEEQVADAEMAEAGAPEATEETENGNAEQAEQGEEAAPAETEGGQSQGETQTNSEQQPEVKEEKVESGKLLVENLPSSFLFDYQEKLKELFSKYGEVVSVKRGPIIVTELTTTPTLSAIVEFKNKESLEKALTEEGTVLDGSPISVAVESRPETAVLVGVPYEASTEYVRLLFAQCGQVAHIHEFSKTKYKIWMPSMGSSGSSPSFHFGSRTATMRVTFHEKEAVEKALKLDRELRINGFLVTVSKYRDEDEQKAHAATVNKNKRQHPPNQNRNQSNASNAAPNQRGGGGGGGNSFRGRGGGPGPTFPSRGNFRGARGRGGFGGRGGGVFPRGGFAPVNAYLPPPQSFMGRPGGFMNDGQRPNKRARLM